MVPLIPFFCGQALECTANGKNQNPGVALLLAKQNIERYYSHVGVLEYIESSLELLEFTYSSVFTGLVDTYKHSLNEKRIYTTPDRYRQSITNETIEILRSALKYDFDLYNFILQRFVNKYRQSFNRVPKKNDETF